MTKPTVAERAESRSSIFVGFHGDMARAGALDVRVEDGDEK
jgi:hypothetical protein